MASARPDPVMIDTESELINLAEKLQSEKVLAIDVEAMARRPGGDMGLHHGRLALLQICAAKGPVYLVDICALKASCVGKRLRPIFESPKILKLFFDVCKDSEALACQLGMLVQNALDLQLCCVCARWRSEGNNHRMGWAAALETYLGRYIVQITQKGVPKSDRFSTIMDAIRARTHDVWDVRPLPPLHVEYACGDVIHMHRLHAHLLTHHPHCVPHGQVLTKKYLGFYCTGKLLETPVDVKPQLVNLQWLLEAAAHTPKAASETSEPPAQKRKLN